MIHTLATRVGVDALLAAVPAFSDAGAAPRAILLAAAALFVAGDAARALRSRSARLILPGAVSLAILALAVRVFVAAPTPEEPVSPEAQARAEIEQTLADIVGAVAANDLERALGFVSQGAPQTRAILERNRNSVKIDEAAATNLRIDGLNLDVYPPAAFVSFHASVNGTATAWPTPIRLPYRVELDFRDVMLRREADGVWRVADYYTIIPPGASAPTAGRGGGNTPPAKENYYGGYLPYGVPDAAPGNHALLAPADPNSIMNGLGFTLEPPAIHRRRTPDRGREEIDFGFDDEPAAPGLSDVEALEADLESNLPSPPVRRGE